MMDELLDRKSEIMEAIDNHRYTIFLLEDELEQIEEELAELHDQQRQAEDLAWRQMKL